MYTGTSIALFRTAALQARRIAYPLSILSGPTASSVAFYWGPSRPRYQGLLYSNTRSNTEDVLDVRIFGTVEDTDGKESPLCPF